MTEVTAEVKAMIADAVEEATEGLANKNRELLADLRKAKAGKNIDPADIEKLESQIDSLKAELTTAQKAANTATKQAEDAAKALQAESGFTQKLLIENGLAAELTKNGVTNAVNLKAAQSMLKDGVKVVIDGDARVAKVGDKALSDYIKEWAGSDEGKHFVSAPLNGGGGAIGGGGKATGKTMSRSAFESASPADKAGFIGAGGTLTD